MGDTDEMDDVNDEAGPSRMVERLARSLASSGDGGLDTEHAAVWDALWSLGPEDRAIVVLHDVEHVGVPDLALALATSEPRILHGLAGARRALGVGPLATAWGSEDHERIARLAQVTQPPEGFRRRLLTAVRGRLLPPP